LIAAQNDIGVLVKEHDEPKLHRREIKNLVFVASSEPASIDFTPAEHEAMGDIRRVE